jgi:intracellular septation protein A
MSRFRGILAFAAAEFGPLALFWVLNLTFGVRVAIAGAIVAILADSAWRWSHGLAFTRLYMLTSGLTLAFGAVDLISTTPFMLKYEAVVTNLALAAAFVYGAFGEKPMIQEVAERREGLLPDTPEIRRFFQIFTLAWAVYFVAKAALYLYLALILPLAEAMVWRAALGGVSLGLMTLVSATQGKRLFFLCRRLGLLPSPGPAVAAEEAR